MLLYSDFRWIHDSASPSVRKLMNLTDEELNKMIVELNIYMGLDIFIEMSNYCSLDYFLEELKKNASLINLPYKDIIVDVERDRFDEGDNHHIVLKARRQADLSMEKERQIICIRIEQETQMRKTKEQKDRELYLELKKKYEGNK